VDTRYADLETELCRIPEVSAARVVVDGEGHPTEVHILASPEKHAKQVARDIQSVAMASFGLDLDRRLISVVQLEGETSPSPAISEGRPPSMYRGSPRSDDLAAEPQPSFTNPAFTPASFITDPVITDPVITDAGVPESERASAAAPATHKREADRVVVDGVVTVRSSHTCLTEVTLVRSGNHAKGRAEGSVASRVALRIVAEATLDALRHLEPTASRADVEAVSLVRQGDRTVALVTVSVVQPPYEEVMAGAAVVRAAGEHDAVARATLDAVNRRLAHIR
jgi:hypothetical protein